MYCSTNYMCHYYISAGASASHAGCGRFFRSSPSTKLELSVPPRPGLVKENSLDMESIKLTRMADFLRQAYDYWQDQPGLFHRQGFVSGRGVRVRALDIYFAVLAVAVFHIRPSLRPCVPASLRPCVPASLRPCVPASPRPRVPASLRPSVPPSLRPSVPSSLRPSK